MAVYKDEDINVALINDKFPRVASAIIAQANESTPALTAESFKNQYPDLAASFVAEGKDVGIDEGKIAGAKAEAGRVASIEAEAMPGYEDIVAAAKADGKSTAQDVKLAIFDAMKEKSVNAKKARSTDGVNLAKQVVELNADALPNADESAAEKRAAEERMAKAGKKARGEK